MADLQPTDTLLVNRAGIDHSIAKADVMATVQDTDLLLVNRAGVDYQATYADVKKGFGPQQINPAPGDWTFNPAIVSGTGTQADPFIITPETVNTPGGTVQSAQTLTLTGLNPNDLVEWTDHSVGAGNRFHQLLALVPPSGQVDLKLNYIDTPASTTGQTFTGDLQIGSTYFRWVVTQVATVAPDVGTVTLSDVAGGDRFTSEVFPVSATMTEDGIPTSSKALKAWVEGTLQRQPVSSAITQVAADTPSAGQTTLTLTDNTDLANFAPGDAVTELGGGDDATGTVGSVDTVGNTITLSASAGTWDVGSQVVGPAKTITVTPESDEIVQVVTESPATVYEVASTPQEADRSTLTASTARKTVNVGNVPQSQGVAAGSLLLHVSTGSIVFGKPGGVSPIVTFYYEESDDGILWSATKTWVGNNSNFSVPTKWLRISQHENGSYAGFNTAVWTVVGAVASATLTLKTDKELLQFAPGDAVNQDNSSMSPGFTTYEAQYGSANWTGSQATGSVGTVPTPANTRTDYIIFKPDTPGFVNIGIYPVNNNDTRVVSLHVSPDGSNWTLASSLPVTEMNGVVSRKQLHGYGAYVRLSGLPNFNSNGWFPGISTTPIPFGTVASVDTTANTITLSDVVGTWSANTGNWVIGPTKPSSSVKLYCKLDAAGAVSDLQSADPGFTAWTPTGTGPYTGTIGFPATLPTGNPPDTDLPAGTQLTVEVEASNTAGTDSAKSNTITPA